MSLISTIVLVSAFTGVASHILYFVQGQHDHATVQYIGITAIATTTTPLLLSMVTDLSRNAAFVVSSIAFGSFTLGLFSSIVMYRAFFHRLTSFPGPKTWAISKLFQLRANSDWRAYAHLHSLHQKHGLFVRIGPTELSVIHHDAPQVILGPATKCTKGIWYDMAQPLRTMHQTCNIAIHDFRRRNWDKAFSVKALQNYEPIVEEYAEIFVRNIQAQSLKPMNMTEWSYWYAWDIIGKLAFGSRFKALERGKAHFAIAYLFQYIRPMGIFIPIPWLFQIFKTIRSASSHDHPFIAWCNKQLDARIAEKTEREDVLSHLLKAPLMTKDATVNRSWLEGDARLLVVAGSDTVAAVLASTCCELIRQPAYIKALRDELELISQQKKISSTSLAKAPLLNATINEVLRLHHPVPSGLVRQTPLEGIKLGETFIPGGITITVPFHALQRSAHSFVKPDKFIPERWTTKSELVLHPNAFAPFSLGRYNCVGKRLAQMEIRAALAKILMNFEMEFAPGEDGTNFENRLEDHFITSPGDLWIVFRPREIIVN